MTEELNFPVHAPRGGIPINTVYYGRGINKYSDPMAWLEKNIQEQPHLLQMAIDHWQGLNDRGIRRSLENYIRLRDAAITLDTDFENYLSQLPRSRTGAARYLKKDYEKYNNAFSEIRNEESKLYNEIEGILREPNREEYKRMGRGDDENLLMFLNRRQLGQSQSDILAFRRRRNQQYRQYQEDQEDQEESKDQDMD